MSSEAIEAPAAPGKSCGTCTLCCKVMEIPELSKPAGQWCVHCKPGQGCGIHAERPDHCRAFGCLWLTQAWMGPEWKPDRCRFVLSVESKTGFLVLQLDPGHANAWRQEPYHSQLRRWALQAQTNNRFLLVFNRRRATVVLPDGERDLGDLGPDVKLAVRERRSLAGPIRELVRVA